MKNYNEFVQQLVNMYISKESDNDNIITPREAAIIISTAIDEIHMLEELLAE